MSDSSNNDQQLQSAKLQIQLGQLDTAISSLRTLLEGRPLHRDGLYYLAVCQRKAKDQGARQTLDVLKSAHPLYGRAYQEEGHLYKAEGNAAAAALAYEQAVRHNPALLRSWKRLVKYYQSTGNPEAAKQAIKQVQCLSNLPPELLTVTSLIHEDKLYMAEQICRYYLQKHKHHTEGIRLLAEIGSKLQMLDDAESLLESCVEIDPEYSRARMDYVQVLHKRQKFQLALEQAKILDAKSPNSVAFEIVLAKQTQAVGDFEQALKIYDRVIRRGENLHTIYAARGHALETGGKTGQAIKSYQQAYTCKADYGDAYWSLANLKTYRFNDTELDQMRTQESAADISENDRVHICFALGKALEGRQQFAESFEYYDRGNALKRAQSRYQAETIEQEFKKHRNLFTADFFAEHSGLGIPDPAPIFIVGLPCSGTTLLEQILTSHSQVDASMELANIIGLAHRLNGRKKLHLEIRYPEILSELRSEKFRQFGDEYIKDTQFHRQGGLCFVDKMSNNFQHIALIHLILPNAKIIDARRHPMACCLNGFQQLFAESHEFTYGLEEIGRYYRAYVDLMNHWELALPGKVLKVQHEDVIEGLQQQAERILEFCELPYEQQCVDLYKTERVVSTLSSEQVHQPISENGMQQWRNYEEHLQPLVNALGPGFEPF